MCVCVCDDLTMTQFTSEYINKALEYKDKSSLEEYESKAIRKLLEIDKRGYLENYNKALKGNDGGQKYLDMRTMVGEAHDRYMGNKEPTMSGELIVAWKKAMNDFDKWEEKTIEENAGGEFKQDYRTRKMITRYINAVQQELLNQSLSGFN